MKNNDHELPNGKAAISGNSYTAFICASNVNNSNTEKARRETGKSEHSPGICHSRSTHHQDPKDVNLSRKAEMMEIFF